MPRLSLLLAIALPIAFVAAMPVASVKTARQHAACGDWLPAFDHSVVWVPGEQLTITWDPSTAPTTYCSMSPSVQNADAATGQGSPWGVYIGPDSFDALSGSFTFTVPTPPSPGEYYLQITEVDDVENIFHAIDPEPVTVS